MHAAALMQGLGALKWYDGGNLRIDWRWAAGNPALYEQYAIELIALQPEVLVAWGSPSVAALRRQMNTIPIVLVNVTDPVGQGFRAGQASFDWAAVRPISPVNGWDDGGS